MNLLQCPKLMRLGLATIILLRPRRQGRIVSLGGGHWIAFRTSLNGLHLA
jgi:hypothetical protein